jgi:hypothetical protein
MVHVVGHRGYHRSVATVVGCFPLFRAGIPGALAAFIELKLFAR